MGISICLLTTTTSINVLSTKMSLFSLWKVERGQSINSNCILTGGTRSFFWRYFRVLSISGTTLLHKCIQHKKRESGYTGIYNTNTTACVGISWLIHESFQSIQYIRTVRKYGLNCSLYALQDVLITLFTVTNAFCFITSLGWADVKKNMQILSTASKKKIITCISCQTA